MRILVYFMHRDGWSIHCLAEDARTILTKWTDVSSEGTMLRLFRACGANGDDIAHVERDIARWGRGSVWLDVDEKAQRLLRIGPRRRAVYFTLG